MWGQAKPLEGGGWACEAKLSQDYILLCLVKLSQDYILPLENLGYDLKWGDILTLEWNMGIHAQADKYYKHIHMHIHIPIEKFSLEWQRLDAARALLPAQTHTYTYLQPWKAKAWFHTRGAKDHRRKAASCWHHTACIQFMYVRFCFGSYRHVVSATSAGNIDATMVQQGWQMHVCTTESSPLIYTTNTTPPSH